MNKGLMQAAKASVDEWGLDTMLVIERDVNPHPQHPPTEDEHGPWWWACQHPEKNDETWWCRWDFECWACYVALFSVALFAPDMTGVVNNDDGSRNSTAVGMFREAHALRVDDELRIIPPAWIEFALAARGSTIR